jgi:phosphoribosyl-ATP pyrophosphohydrolase
MSDSLDRLYASVVAARGRDPSTSRTAKLFRDGVQKMAKKLIEEAIEVGLDAVQMNREAAILESADVLYQLAVVWAECGIAPADVLGEIDRRERVYGIAEKLPKEASAAQARRLLAGAARRTKALV